MLHEALNLVKLQSGGKLGDVYLNTFRDVNLHDLDCFFNQLAALPLNHEPRNMITYHVDCNMIVKPR